MRAVDHNHTKCLTFLNRNYVTKVLFYYEFCEELVNSRLSKDVEM